MFIHPFVFFCCPFFYFSFRFFGNGTLPLQKHQAVRLKHDGRDFLNYSLPRLGQSTFHSIQPPSLYLQAGLVSRSDVSFTSATSIVHTYLPAGSASFYDVSFYLAISIVLSEWHREDDKVFEIIHNSGYIVLFHSLDNSSRKWVAVWVFIFLELNNPLIKASELAAYNKESIVSSHLFVYDH